MSLRNIKTALYLGMQEHSLSFTLITADPSQLWKLDGRILKNKANLWVSTDEWNIKTNDDFVYIENVSKNKVLGSTDYDDIIEELTRSENLDYDE